MEMPHEMKRYLARDTGIGHMKLNIFSSSNVLNAKLFILSFFIFRGEKEV